MKKMKLKMKKIQHKKLAFGLNNNPLGTGAGAAYSGTKWKLGEIIGGNMGGHSNIVTSVAFSPDGMEFVSASSDTTLIVWDAKDGQEKFTVKGHQDSVTSVVFSPDGTELLSGSSDKTVRIWDAKSGAEKLCMAGHLWDVLAVAFSPNGKEVVSGSYDATARIWDAKTGLEIGVLEHDGKAVCAVAFSPDGNEIVSGSQDETVRVWKLVNVDPPNATAPSISRNAVSAETSRVQTRTGVARLKLEGHTWHVTSVAWSPDGTSLVSGSLDKTLCVWDAINGREKLRLTGHEASVSSVAFSPNGSEIISGGEDQTVRVWDALSGTEKLSIALYDSPLKQTRKVTSVAFIPDRSKFICGCDDHSVRMCFSKSGETSTELLGHENHVTSVAFSFDSTAIISGSSDQTVRIWDAKSGEVKHTLQGHEAGVTSVALNVDGTEIVSASHDTTLRVWDATNGGIWAAKLTLTGHTDSVLSAAFSVMGTIASGSRDRTIRVWDAKTGLTLLLLEGHESDVTAVAFSPSGRDVVSGSNDTTVRVWDTTTTAKNKHLKWTLRGHEHNVLCVSYSPDGTEIVSGSYNNSMIVCEAESGVEKLTLKGHVYGVYSVAYSPDGKDIVSGSSDMTMRVWDAKSGCEKLLLNGHKDVVYGVTFSPDGTEIVSASADKTLRSWPYSYFRNFSPDVLYATYFLPDLTDAKNSADFDWSTSWTSIILKRNPRSLIGTTNAKGWNIVHAAASMGNCAFLKHFLQTEDPVLKPFALVACLMLDNFKFTPLHYAVETKDSESMSSILECLLQVSSRENCRMRDKADQTRQHAGDIFPLRDLIDLMWAFPAVFLMHVDNMTMVSNYSAMVGGKKAVVEEGDAIVLGSSYRSPDQFWGKHYDEEGITAVPKLLPFKGLAGSANNFLAAAVYAAQKTNKYGFFMSPIVVACINFKWNSHVKKLFIKQICMHIVMVVFFTIESLLASGEADRSTKADRSTVIARIVCCCLTLTAWCYFVFHELRTALADNEDEKRAEEKEKKRMSRMEKKLGSQNSAPRSLVVPTSAEQTSSSAHEKQTSSTREEKTSPRSPASKPGMNIRLFYLIKYLDNFTQSSVLMEFYEHFTHSVWNMVDFMSLLFVLATYVFRAVEISGRAFPMVSHITSALALPLLYLNFLKYMQGFESSGKLVSMVVGITKGIADFTLILFLVCLGFAFAFHVLYKSGPGTIQCGDDQVFTQSDAIMAVLGSYTLMLGDFDVEQYTATSSLTTSILLFVVFMFGVNIVLLNLLIAIMGDIYGEIQQNATEQFLFSKTMIILEFESIMPEKDKLDETKFPPYLQILKPKSDDVDPVEAWSENLMAVTGEVKKNGDDIRKVEDMTSEVRSELKKCAAEIAALKEGMNAILELLKRSPQE
jgi:WD40 repeat protein